MSLSEKDTQKIAQLARIRLTDQEILEMREKLNQILGWVEQLQQVNTDNVPAMSGMGDQGLRWRKDEITDGNRKDEILANAPGAAYDCFTVPKVVE